MYLGRILKYILKYIDVFQQQRNRAEDCNPNGMSEEDAIRWAINASLQGMYFRFQINQTVVVKTELIVLKIVDTARRGK